MTRKLCSTNRRRGDTARIVLASAVLGVAGSIASGMASRADASVLAPRLDLHMTSVVVPASGAKIVMAATVENATTCTLSSTPTLPGWERSFPCHDAVIRRTAVVAQNTTAARRFVLWITVTGAGGSLRRGETLHQLAPPPTPASANWSGYVVPSAGSLITEASGEWTVPTLDCANTPNGGAATWVGIGGYGGRSGALIQTGVDAICVDGAQQDLPWWEIYPSDPNYDIYFNDFTVSPGDSLKASILQTSTGSWETRLDDLSTGQSGIMVTGAIWGVYTDGSHAPFPEQGSTAGASYAGGYTAEWIVEDYTLFASGQEAPFADYGTVSFSDLTTSLPSWSLTPSEELELSPGGTVLSTPSAPSNDGFSVSYTG